MSARLPDGEIIVAEFEKNSKDTVRISLQNLYGHDLLNLRVFYRDKDGALKPGRDGLAIKIEQFPLLAAGLASAGNKLKELGML